MHIKYLEEGTAQSELSKVSCCYINESGSATNGLQVVVLLRAFCYYLSE